MLRAEDIKYYSVSLWNAGLFQIFESQVSTVRTRDLKNVSK